MFSTVWNRQRFTELGREEKGEGGNRGDLVEKNESPKEERATKPVITVWTTQRYSWSYTEKRRGRKETEVARRIKREIKKRDRSSQ